MPSALIHTLQNSNAFPPMLVTGLSSLPAIASKGAYSAFS